MTRPFPETIYHYTSASGLRGILSSGILYFTDSQFLNDRSERKNFYQMLADRLKGWVPDLKEILEHRYFSRQSPVLRSLSMAEPADKDASRYFVLSCSQEKDSLPMWNYYTRGARAAGYNIHFSTSALMEQLQAHPLIQRINCQPRLLCGRVVYQDAEKEQGLEGLLEEICQKWREEKEPREREELLLRADLAFEKMSLFYKDQAFAHEKEIRVVIPSNNRRIHSLSADDSESPYRFREVRGAQVPYLALDVLEKGRAITGVTAGPALDEEMAVKGVEYMLYCYGFPQTCKVSAVPLRY